MEPVLQLDRVSYRYPGATEAALSEVSLSVGPGELVVLAGSSGSGKSTLLGTASGLVPHFHGGRFAGTVRVAGLDTRRHGPGELAAAVGTLFQDPETQVVMGTVRAEIALPLENRGLAPAVVARGVEEAALALGIAHLLDRLTGELSGGELQRVALAGALAGQPQLLVLDEPTSQLDPVAGDELMGTLRRINEDRDTAVLLAEHRLERCLPWADRVVALAGGRIVCDAPPPEFLAWALSDAPELATPGARLLHGAGFSPVAGVKAARRILRKQGLLIGQPAPAPAPMTSSGKRGQQALRFDGVWQELREGPAILRSVSLRVGPGERVALMGANGAGKSTLLRHAAGLDEPTRGRVVRGGRVALLLQNPSDYLVHETVGAEAPAAALRAVGLEPDDFAHRHPREISVGEKQRVALAVVLGDSASATAAGSGAGVTAAGSGAGAPAVVCLDEPTRGLDRRRKRQLAELLRGLPAALIVATHDPEFAAELAERVILLAHGRVVADGPIGEILSTGTYFATETARILGGAGGALTPEQGVALLTGAACDGASQAQEPVLAEATP